MVNDLFILLISIAYLFFSLDVVLAYKYKIMYKSENKYLLAFIHSMILITNILFIMYLALNYYSTPFLLIRIFGGLLILFGVFISFYSLYTLRESAILPRNKLIIKGPFYYVRHPIYLGYIFIVFGISLVFGSLHLLIYSLFLIISLKILAKSEEKGLIGRFGRLYSDYTKKVPQFNFIKRLIS